MTKRKSIIFTFFMLLVLCAVSNAAVMDSHTKGGLGGGANNFTGGRHSWDASRIQVTSSYTIDKIKLRVRRVECLGGGETSGCKAGADRTHPYFDVRIYTHDSANDRPGTMIGNVSSETLNFNDLTNMTTDDGDLATPFVDVWFTGLNAPVKAGLYWIVVHNVDWANVYPNHLDHFLQFEATDMSPLGGGSRYGREVSYTTGNVENKVSWTEKYTGQQNYVLEDGGATGVTEPKTPSAPTSLR